MSLDVVILAAGRGTRMRSKLPKVLHELAGRPLLSHVIEQAQELEPASVHVVYGHGGDQVMLQLADADVEWVEQTEQLGTGHALKQAIPDIDDDHLLLVLYGDVPLVEESTLRRLVTSAQSAAISLLTVTMDDPTGYGRIVRDENGKVQAIVEQKDASATEREIKEVNTGLLAAKAGPLKKWLASVKNDNAQAEYYLTDIVGIATKKSLNVTTVSANVAEVAGVNDRSQLAAVERVYQRRQAKALMASGVTMTQPDSVTIRGSVRCEEDVVIDQNVLFEGTVTIAAGTRIGANCIIRDADIGEQVSIEPYSFLDGVKVGDEACIGPYARLRPETEIGKAARVGNFVEVKKSQIAAGAKLNHLSYIGDASVGQRVNIGAGTITCNYDGVNKHRTEIGDDAFIGSDTQLVAPVVIGAGATIGAGTTLTRDAPAGKLTVSRARQKTLAHWQRPTKEED